jgi:hypothetical protein
MGKRRSTGTNSTLAAPLPAGASPGRSEPQ